MGITAWLDTATLSRLILPCRLPLWSASPAARRRLVFMIARDRRWEDWAIASATNWSLFSNAAIVVVFVLWWRKIHHHAIIALPRRGECWSWWFGRLDRRFVIVYWSGKKVLVFGSRSCWYSMIRRDTTTRIAHHFKHDLLLLRWDSASLSVVSAFHHD